MQYPQIDPVAISLGPVSVHWYGLMYLFAFGFAWALALHRTKQPWSPIKKEQVEDLVFYAAMGIIIGGRVGYCVFYGLDNLLQNPLWLFKVWEGGMSFHGGAIGLAVAVGLFARKINKPVFEVLDWMVPFTPIGLLLGRIGNFIGQELWGRATDVPWAMVFPRDPLALARHPSQLYEAFLEGVVLFLILFFYSTKPRARGRVSAMFLIGYGLFRGFVEMFRQPDAHIGFQLLGLTRGQWLCVPMILFGLYLFYYSKNHQRST